MEEHTHSLCFTYKCRYCEQRFVLVTCPDIPRFRIAIEKAPQGIPVPVEDLNGRTVVVTDITLHECHNRPGEFKQWGIADFIGARQYYADGNESGK